MSIGGTCLLLSATGDGGLLGCSTLTMQCWGGGSTSSPPPRSSSWPGSLPFWPNACAVTALGGSSSMRDFRGGSWPTLCSIGTGVSTSCSRSPIQTVTVRHSTILNAPCFQSNPCSLPVKTWGGDQSHLSNTVVVMPEWTVLVSPRRRTTRSTGPLARVGSPRPVNVGVRRTGIGRMSLWVYGGAEEAVMPADGSHRARLIVRFG